MTSIVYTVHKQNKETLKKQAVEGWGPFIDGGFAQAVVADLNHRFPASTYFLRWKRVRTERGTYRECIAALLHAAPKKFVKVSSCPRSVRPFGATGTEASRSLGFGPDFSTDTSSSNSPFGGSR